MKKLALLGKHLGHTFSPRYFKEKFENENIIGFSYGTLELDDISKFPSALKKEPELIGLNVTIPYKEAVIPYLDCLDEIAKAIGAVNTIRVEKTRLVGFNTDVIGFKRSLVNFIPENFDSEALILGTGGAGKAVKFVLSEMDVPYKVVSRRPVPEGLTYGDLTRESIKDYRLIINTTPLGMYPEVEACPDLPYKGLESSHYLYDLIYNPEETLFMKKGKEQGALVKNGYEMLVQQAEGSWEIWNREG